MKLEPVTFSVNCGPPAVTDVGLTLLIAGTGFGCALIVKVCAFEVPPPGSGFTTMTFALPCDCTSAVVIDAVSWLGETYDVGRPEPFHCTVDEATNPEPFTVRVNPALPAFALVGLIDVV